MMGKLENCVDKGEKIHQISEVGEKMLLLQEQRAKEFKYKPIPVTMFENVRKEYQENLPEWCKLDGDCRALVTTDGTLICSGYTRIVIGDYGAFVEFTLRQANTVSFFMKRGQEYRYKDPRYMHTVKYGWLTAKDSSDIKIYEQFRPVAYADYKAGMYYASVYECFPA